MNSYSSYPNTPAGFPTGQREHEQHPIQTRPQYSDNRDPFNGFQSDPWSSQNWSEFPQAPGSMTFSSQYPGHHNTLWESPALETNESTSRYNPHSSLTTSKVITLCFWVWFHLLVRMSSLSSIGHSRMEQRSWFSSIFIQRIRWSPSPSVTITVFWQHKPHKYNKYRW